MCICLYVCTCVYVYLSLCVAVFVAQRPEMHWPSIVQRTNRRSPMLLRFWRRYTLCALICRRRSREKSSFRRIVANLVVHRQERRERKPRLLRCILTFFPALANVIKPEIVTICARNSLWGGWYLTNRVQMKKTEMFIALTRKKARRKVIAKRNRLKRIVIFLRWIFSDWYYTILIKITHFFDLN